MLDKLNEIHDECCGLNRKLWNEAKSVILECFKKYSTTLIAIDRECYPCCVTYDGGNHPEYAANPYSDVNGVYLKNNEIYLHTEDCTTYPITSVTASELYEVACSSVMSLEEGFTYEEDDEVE